MLAALSFHLPCWKIIITRKLDEWWWFGGWSIELLLSHPYFLPLLLHLFLQKGRFDTFRGPLSPENGMVRTFLGA